MKHWIVLLFLVASVAARSRKYERLVAGEDGEKQSKVLELYSHISTQDAFQHERKPFPFNDPQLFTDPTALKNFTDAYDMHFLDLDHTFSFTHTRSPMEVMTIFDLFFFAKDFDTFYQVANWAKSEIQSDQYILALSMAVLHRQDTTSLALPPFYEALPHYFVPSTVILQAYKAKLNGIESRKFQVNNTGWEEGWFTHYQRAHNAYSPFTVMQDSQYSDIEGRLAYYREDVGRSDFFIKFFFKVNGILSNSAKYGHQHSRIGEWYYASIKWIVARYNLERYALDMPPVRPIDFDRPIKTGYDPQMIGIHGHVIPGRPDNIVPRVSNSQGVAHFEQIARRFYEAADSQYMWFISNEDKANLLNSFSYRMFVGDYKYYPALFLNLLQLIDGTSHSANNVEVPDGVIMNYYTKFRDPAFFRILTNLNNVFTLWESKYKPYTKAELSYPGVQITGVDVSRLETYFENYEFDISNGVPGAQAGQYTVSKFRINHKPFSMSIKINSDKESQATIKMFLGPLTDSVNNTLELNKLRGHLFLMDSFPVTLKPGQNVFERKSDQVNATADTPLFKDIKEKTEPVAMNQCPYPNNLVLPKGSKYGTPFKLYVVVYPTGSVSGSQDQEGKDYSCGYDHLTHDTAHSFTYPVDRMWYKSGINQPNHFFTETLVYHYSQPQEISQPTNVQ